MKSLRFSFTLFWGGRQFTFVHRISYLIHRPLASDEAARLFVCYRPSDLCTISLV